MKRRIFKLLIIASFLSQVSCERRIERGIISCKDYEITPSKSIQITKIVFKGHLRCLGHDFKGEINPEWVIEKNQDTILTFLNGSSVKIEALIEGVKIPQRYKIDPLCFIDKKRIKINNLGLKENIFSISFNLPKDLKINNRNHYKDIHSLKIEWRISSDEFNELQITKHKFKVVMPQIGKVVPPKYGGCYVGHYLPRYGSYSKVDKGIRDLFCLEEKVGHFSAIFYRRYRFYDYIFEKEPGSKGSFGKIDIDLLKDRVVTLALGWFISTHKDTTEDICRDVIKGRKDRYIVEFALKIKKANLPVMLESYREYDNKEHGDIEPVNFRDYYRHIVDVFNELEVSNVTWFLHGKDELFYESRPQLYYPGDNYVDWVGNSYFYGLSGRGKHFQDTGYRWTKVTNKPIFAPRYGPYCGSTPKDLERNLTSIIPNYFPNLKAITFSGFSTTYNFRKPKDKEYLRWRRIVNGRFKHFYKKYCEFSGDPEHGGDFTPPGKINDLKAASLGKGKFLLNFTAPGDDNYNGVARYYIIKYSHNYIFAINLDKRRGNYFSDSQRVWEIPFEDMDFINEERRSIKINRGFIEEESEGNMENMYINRLKPKPAKRKEIFIVNIRDFNLEKDYYFTVVSVDDTNYTSPLSNIAKAE